MIIEIPGTPISKARHRTYYRYGKARTYDPQAREKKIIQSHIETAMKKNNWKRTNKKITVQFEFYFPVPKSIPVYKQKLYLWGHYDHLINQDCDNCEKFYIDCANKLLYNDDRQVVDCSSKKTYAIEGKTVMYIEIEKEEECLDPKYLEILSIFSPQDVFDLCKQVRQIDNYLMTEQTIRFTADDQEFICGLLMQIAKNHSKKFSQVAKL